MASSLSNLVNNPSEGIHKVKCKYRYNDKKCETCGIIYKACDCFLEYTNFKNANVYKVCLYKCSYGNKNYQKKFNEKLKELFLNTYKFSNRDNNKFTLFLRKGVYPYEYMDDWEKFNETSLPEKEDFCSHLNMEDITGADYAYAKRICKDFEKNI